MSLIYSIDFACNDPDNGQFAGKVWRADINDCELEAKGCRPVAFTVVQRGEKRAIRIHRSLFEIKARKEWLGNWCWDRFWFAEDEFQRLLNHLLKNGWSCSSGEGDFKELMNKAAS